MSDEKLTVVDFIKMKQRHERIAMLTAYDYNMASLMDSAGVDGILVGDSLGVVVLGYKDTLKVTMEDMICHGAAVVRGRKRALVVIDMPFMSYQVSVEESIKNAGRLIQQTGADAVKLEGGSQYADRVKAIVEAGIPVMGHLGLTPQSIHRFGGYGVRGRTRDEAQRILDDAIILEQAGAFSIVLECVPQELAGNIIKQLSIPVIGIGAGPLCDGQILVSNDMLGMFSDFTPKFVKRYADIGESVIQAIKAYTVEVKANIFPNADYSY
ncbi:MAG: 3-methyl-2-oxobutanoate hydroxymethyltransferase [Clostridiales bacterium]|nr:3-methyl-2-oxobutanoate hydroxymethyltransferase [Clostridiales bacterium]